MRHFIDGWPVQDAHGGIGRIVEAPTSVAGHRPPIAEDALELPGRRGRVATFGAMPGEQQYVMSVVLAGETHEHAARMLSDLHRRLPSGRAVTLRRETAEWSREAAAVVYAGTDVEGLDVGNQTLRVKIVCTIPGGVWLDASPSSAPLPVGTSTVGALAGGSAEMAAAFTVVGDGPSTMVEVEDVATGAWWRLAGDITAGVEAHVDPLAHTVRASDGSDLSRLLVVGDRPFYLSAVPVVTHTRNGAQQTTVTAHRSWYE